MKVYSKENCGKCNMAKGVLKAKGIPFEAIDDFETVMEKITQTGMMEMPIIETTEGETFNGTEAVRYIKKI